MRNWQEYKQFMPDGMIALFSARTGANAVARESIEVRALVFWPPENVNS
jgi:hypothetical protein